MARVLSGDIEHVLQTGEYDQGDRVMIAYDELADLVAQAQILRECAGWQHEVDEVKTLEQQTNRPLHPCLGGKSPYSEFLRSA